MDWLIFVSFLFLVGTAGPVSFGQNFRTPAAIVKETGPSTTPSLSVDKARAILDKQPKSLFLIKKAKINSEVGGPLFYPVEAQLRTIINDSTLHNFKKFE